MNKKILIAPSILTVDYMHLEEEIKKIENSDINYWHLDIMDGHFVPQISFGQSIVKVLKKNTRMPIEAHLMVSNPEIQALSFLKIGIERVIVHIESIKDPTFLINKTHSMNKEFGLAINPGTSISDIEPFLSKIDQVTIMSVNPGEGGQSMIMQSLDKIKYLIEISKKNKNQFNIEIDGGVKIENLHSCIESGANMLVMGSSIFNQDLDRDKTITKIRMKIDNIQNLTDDANN